MFRILDTRSLRRAVVAAPRHFGKTTIDGLFFPAKETLFRKIKYGLFISATQPKAIEDLTTLKRELTWNPRVVKVFGQLKPQTREMKFADMAFELAFRDEPGGPIVHTVKWAAKGANQQFRGIKYGNQRPDLIIVDDLEDPDDVDNPELRKKLRRRFMADIMKSVDIKTTRVIVLGTILHEDSLLCELLESDQWFSTTIELCTNEFKSNWPEFMTDEEIYNDYLEYERMGEADTWMREVRNKVVTLETMSFRPELFKRFDEMELMRDIMRERVSLITAVIVDPAREIKMQNDDSAILGVSLDTMNGRILVRDLVRGRMMPDEIYQEAVDMARRLQTVNIGIEDHGLHQFIRWPFEQFLRVQPDGFNVTWLKPGGKDKNERIKALLPLYRQGFIYHNKNSSVSGPLEEQLMAFPRSKKDDVSDCLAYITQMFDLNKVFMGTAPVSLRENKRERPVNLDELDIEYEAMIDAMNEPALPDGWQVMM